jgi:hypothetical protein
MRRITIPIVQASVAEGRAARLRAAGRTAKAINLMATAGAAKREAREAEEAAAKLREEAATQLPGEGNLVKEAEEARQVAEEQETAADRLHDVSKVGKECLNVCLCMTLSVYSLLLTIKDK